MDEILMLYVGEAIAIALLIAAIIQDRIDFRQCLLKTIQAHDIIKKRGVKMLFCITSSRANSAYYGFELISSPEEYLPQNAKRIGKAIDTVTEDDKLIVYGIDVDSLPELIAIADSNAIVIHKIGGRKASSVFTDLYDIIWDSDITPPEYVIEIYDDYRE